jgi:hypothetical protein
MLPLTDAVNYAANGGMVPVVAVMGSEDHYFSSHLLIQRAFADERVPLNGFVDYGAGHGVSRDAIEAYLQLLRCYAAQPRNPTPEHVRFVTWTLKFNRCCWLEILGLHEHYRRSEVEARRSEDGSVHVTKCQNVARLSIDLPPERGESATLTVEGNEIGLPEDAVAGAIVVQRIDGRWQYAGRREGVELTGKRPGLQGPIDDAFSTRFLCVRGTGTPWNAQVGQWADACLNRLTDEWRRHYRGYLPVKDDADVTPDDLQRSNLILFGDPGSNRWIRDILPQLPVQWTRETVGLGDRQFAARDHGLQLICPNPLPGAEGRYVVLNSGHTYHDEELRFSYMVFPRLGDWAVTQAGDNSQSQASAVDETIVESGFFDESWKQPVFVTDGHD